MVNDITLIMGVVIVFIGIGTLLPYIEADFGDTDSSTDIDGLNSDLAENHTTISFWKVMLSIGSMFFWSFGAIPFWLDAFLFMPMRIMLILTVARNIWVGGGS